MCTFAIAMERGHIETIKVRFISVCFAVLALAVFKPFGLTAWQWEAYAHVAAIGLLGLGVCMCTEFILRFVVRMPRSYERGADYIIRRNLWFQCINTLLVSLMICLYRHWVLSSLVADNQLSWANFLKTLVIIGFCSFAIGLYWRYKFRSRYLAAEVEELLVLNEQLSASQSAAEYDDETTTTIELTGTTSERITLNIADLLYIEAVGNYAKVYQWNGKEVKVDMLRATMKQLADDLSCHQMIVRSHRAFLVNLLQVEQIVSKSGAMQLMIRHCHDAIPVSRSNVADIKEILKLLRS